MKPQTLERLTLAILVAYWVDLAWKLAHWNQLSKGLEWWIIALALMVRFAFMGFLLAVFLRARRARRSKNEL
jgi:hypothetical protein